MNAMKNAAHGLALFAWVVAGALFSLKSLAAGQAMPVVFFWAWFAGYAALTTVIAAQFKSLPAALATHAGTLFALTLVPKVMPFLLLRYGLDLVF